MELESTEPLAVALNALEREDLLKEQLVAKDDGGRTVLHLAALSGDWLTFTTVKEYCTQQGDKSQPSSFSLPNRPGDLLDVFTSKDKDERTVLMMAAASGDRFTFDLVLEATREVLEQHETEMLDVFTSKDKDGRTVLMMAAASEDEFTLDAALKATREVLDQHETEAGCDL
eukprot:g10783.t1